MKNKTTFTNEELKIIGSCCYSIFKSIAASAQEKELSLEDVIFQMKAVIEIKGVLDKIEEALNDAEIDGKAEDIIEKFSNN